MNFRKQLSYLLFFYLLCSVNGFAQEPVVMAKLDTNAMVMGDQIYLNLSVRQSKTDVVRFPKIKDTITKSIEVIDVLPIDTQSISNNRIHVTQKILISAFDMDIYTIPAFAFRYSNDTLLTDSLLLVVNPVSIDSTEKAKIDTSQTIDIFDIKAPIDTPWTFKEFFQLYYIYILVVLAVALLTFLIIYYLKRRAKNKPLFKLPEKPKEPAHIIALRALDELKAKKLWQSGYEKEYYLEITDIIRGYLEQRFNIHTFERTSHEITESIKHMKILDKFLFEELRSLLTLADLAKFAKYKPLPNENDLCLKNAYHFVESTKIEEVINIIENQNEIVQEITEAQEKNKI